jgi:hypothetical protein
MVLLKIKSSGAERFKNFGAMGDGHGCGLWVNSYKN